MDEWPERRARWIWKPIEDLDWCRRKRSDMTQVEREFVEAAVFDAEGNFAPDLNRMKALLVEYPSLVETAGSAALTTAIRAKDADEVVRFLVDNGAQFEYPKDSFSPVHDAAWSASHGQQGIEKFRIIFESRLADPAQIGIQPPHNGLSSSHRSLLHITATFGHPELTELLLKHGAGEVIEARLNRADMPIQEILFRTLLARGNEPMPISEMRLELTDRWSSPLRLIALDEARLRRVLTADKYYGFAEV